MKTKVKSWAAGLMIGLLVVPQVALSATGYVSGTVKRILASHDTYGYCMAQLSGKDDSLSCSQWVTFDCEGNFEGNTKTAANNKYSAAQLAMVARKRVVVYIDDSKKINGQCFATRIDVVN